MNENTYIYIDIQDVEYKKKIVEFILNDWTVSWRILSDEVFIQDSSIVDIAILDNDNFFTMISKNSLNIYLGTTPNQSSCFSILIDHTPQSIFLEIKKAYFYQQTIKQNLRSQYREINNDLEIVASSFYDRIDTIKKQASMRIELVEQLPIGVIGIDDEMVVVLVNKKAIELCAWDDSSFLGKSIASLFSNEIISFINTIEIDEQLFFINDKQYILRKSDLNLNNEFAGTILTII